MLYARLTRWLSAPRLGLRVALIALLFALPSLAGGLQADDYVLREQLTEGGPFAAYLFSPRDRQAGHEELLAQRAAGRIPWWSGEDSSTRFFRPLSSLSLWFDFAHRAPPWWMHLENCAIYALIAWLGVAIYKQLGLSGAELGWAALFFGLDFGFSTPVGWIACRNTLLATCFGLACVLLHDRARRTQRPGLLPLACVCFALSLLSAELGTCTFAYLCAHALAVDRAPIVRRMLALSPYAALLGLYLANYVVAGYGARNSFIHRDILESPGAAVLGLIESIPIWLATTATLPVASLRLFVPNVHLPILVFSVVVLGILLRLLAAHWTELPQARRIVARSLWRLHGVWMPLLFVPALFGVALGSVGGGAARTLDHVVPRASAPITIVLNPPTWFAPWYQAAMRAYSGEPRPPVFTLYAGSQPLEVERPDARSLELHAARSWFTTPIERGWQTQFRAGDRIALAHLTVEVREVDTTGAPTRARFTFDRPLDDPGLTFRYWNGPDIATWTPPPVGTHQQLAAAAVF
jgi:putative effector of murein hydrolase LrgA (UPF0299 family)